MKVHMVGIAGSGMSALARLLCDEGHQVSGSDLKEAHFLSEARGGKIKVHQGHDASLVSGKDLVVYSSAISPDHIELLEAERLGIPKENRSQILAELMMRKKSIAVSGMHGKTSTTGMIARILLEAQLDPMIAVGGDFAFLDGNARYGRGSWALFEADESDGSLLRYRPQLAVVTHLEPEHVNFFKDFDFILAHFKSFVSQVEDTVLLNWDDSGCRSLALACPDVKFLTYGFSEEAQVRAVNVEVNAWQSQFQVLFSPRPDDIGAGQGQKLGEFHLNVPGIHQVSNALAALGVGGLLGVKPDILQTALSGFENARRRFQARGVVRGVTFIDDYAHHPTEIQATLKAARQCFKGKLLGVFQPHRYTRTLHFKEEFGKALAGLDHGVVTDVYPGHEEPISGVTGRLIYDELIRQGRTNVEYVPDPSDVKEFIRKNFFKFEAVLALGAGSISQWIGEVLDEPLPRGKVVRNEPMSGHTTFRLGGPADLWIEPLDLDDLLYIQGWARERGVPLFVIGNGSNVIIRDGGIRGIVVRLSSPYFRKVEVEGEFLTAGSGASLAQAIQVSLEAGLAGLENLKGIPGTIGGALHFNAGAYGTEIGERIHSLLVLNPNGSLETLSLSRLDFQYRTCPSLRGKIVIQAKFKLAHANPRKVYQRVIELKSKRASVYPRLPNAGCVFKNPGGPDRSVGAGRIVDEIGLKNLTVGGARVSSQHANFIVNTGQAKASDVLALIEEIRKKVYQERKVLLENEVEVVGEE